jgi:16S rRNA (adenine1518-N6/adenine1519-N6)-dimethyltransferase
MSRRRRLGQNFLVDEQVTESIRALLLPTPSRIFEIGPGRGALTEKLLERFSRVLALEVDEKLIPALQYDRPGFEVRLGDALDEDFHALLGAETPWQMAANLPYSVGTAILRRILPLNELFTRLVVMLQKEVAERIVAQPGNRNHALLALERAAWGEARLAFDVPPGAFRPRPKVSSTVIVIDLKAPTASEADIAAGLKLASHALTRPRKVLPNALRPLASEELIIEAGLDPTARPALVSLEQWITLAKISQE